MSGRGWFGDGSALSKDMRDDDAGAGYFNEQTRLLLDGRNVATVATLAADGSPHTSAVWIARDGDTVVFSTTADRLKARNLRRDPRISLTVFAADNPYQSVDIRGTAELVEDTDKPLPAQLSQKYLREAPPPEPADVRRTAEVPGAEYAVPQ